MLLDSLSINDEKLLKTIINSMNRFLNADKKFFKQDDVKIPMKNELICLGGDEKLFGLTKHNIQSISELSFKVLNRFFKE